MPGDLSYGGTARATTRAGKRPDGQHELMLLRFEPLGPGRLFAEMEEAADLKPEIGKSPIVRICKGDGGRKRQVVRVKWLLDRQG